MQVASASIKNQTQHYDYKTLSQGTVSGIWMEDLALDPEASDYEYRQYTQEITALIASQK